MRLTEGQREAAGNVPVHVVQPTHYFIILTLNRKTSYSHSHHVMILKETFIRLDARMLNEYKHHQE